MIAPEAIVFVIDDEESIRKSLSRLLGSSGYQVELFKSAGDYLSRSTHPGPSCVVVDVKMPGLNGMDLQKALIQRRREEQLVFISGHGNIPMSVEAMKAGAVDFLPKPFKPKQLLTCIERALDRSKAQRRQAAEKNQARALLDRLTPREFEVMQMLSTGMLNKQVGGELGMSEKTVKCHRGKVMEKLGIRSVAELIRVMETAEVPGTNNSPTKV